MLLTIIHGLVSLGISAWFGYLFYTNLGPWFALIAIPLTVPIFYILYLLLLTILFLYAMLIKNKKAPEEPSRFYLWLVRQNDFLLMSVLRVKIVMRGKELLPKGQRFLIVTNHRSNFDQMVMIKALKEKPMIYISKPDNFKMPIAGPFIKAAGFIPIDRENATEGIKSIYKAIDLIKEDKASIAISPEGTRNKGEG
ncbi:MAG: 1-acyl-sn-glycerol-3-phosphate acyltransferase, partial [Bacilli bacterium]|nr:1-acyl-sn-glycerol-3-phosphate acyltransferase [Bacilli bacterium]